MATPKSIASPMMPPKRASRHPSPETLTESERWLLKRIRKLDDKALLDLLWALRPSSCAEVRNV